MPTFAKKGVFQSELVAATVNGSLPFILTAHPHPSRFAGKLAYAEFKIAGDEPSVYQLHIENPGIEQHLAALPLNQILYVKAHGSREQALLEVSGNGAAAAPPQYQQPQPPPVSYPAPTTAAPAATYAAQPIPQQGGNGGGYGAETAAVDHRHPVLTRHYHASLLASHEVVGHYIGTHPEYAGLTAGERLTAVMSGAATLFIESNYNRGVRPLTASRIPGSDDHE